MIYFEIIQSPDSGVKSSFKYLKNEVFLGKKSKDLHINDPELKNNHISIKIESNNIFVQPQEEIQYYLINKKDRLVLKKLKSMI